MIRTLFYLNLTLLLSGYYLYGSPAGPDALITLSQVLGAFLLFLFFLLGVFSWGSWLAKKFRAEGTGSELAFGALFFCFLASLLGQLGLIGFSFWPIAVLLLLLGPLLSPLQIRKPEISLRNLPLIFGLLTLSLYLCLSFTLDSMPDPLWYHLTGPRLFSEAGSIYLPETFPIAMKSGLWETLFLWGNQLLGAPKDGGLIAGQYFGQWTHLLIAFLGSVFAFRRVVRNLLPSLDSFWLGIFTLFPLLSNTFVNTAYLAKNDWGAVFFALFGLVMLLEARPRLAGLFLGAAFTAKYTIAFSFLGFVFLLPWNKLKLRQLAELGAFFLAGAAPILLRNAYFTGNPLFPTFNSVFHSPWLGPSWLGIEAFSGSGIQLRRPGQLWELLTQSPFVLFAFLSFVLLPKLKSHWRIAAAGFVPLTLFFLFTGVKAETRLLGAAFLFVPLFGLVGLRQFLSRFKLPPALVFGVFVLLLLPFLKFPWRAPLLLFSYGSPAEEIRYHPGGAASAWLRLNAPEARVASGAETRLYYLLPLGVQRIWDNPELDRKLYAEDSVHGLYKVLDEAGIDYLLLTSSLWDTYFDQARWDLLTKATLKFPEALAYQTQESRVVDIKKMRKLVDTLPRKAN